MDNQEKPTGLLNEDGTMMQVEVLKRNGLGFMQVLGTKWVPVTPEARARIEAANSQMVSTPTVVLTPEMSERLYIDPPVVATAVQDVAYTGVPVKVALTSVQGTDGAPGNLAVTAEEEQEWMARSSSYGEIGNWTTKAHASDLQTEVVADSDDPDQMAGRLSDQPVPSLHDQLAQRLNDESRALAASRMPEHSGFDVNYYCVEIKHPKRPERAPYIFEVEDLIQTLNLGFHEATVLKSLVRSATERELGLVKQGGDAVRDAEKMVHSSKEHLRALKIRLEK